MRIFYLYVRGVLVESSHKLLEGVVIKKVVTFAVLAVLALQANAIYKCTGTDGKLAFQDAPCDGKGEQIKVMPSRGAVGKQAPESKPVTKSKDEVQYEILKSERIRREKWFEMRDTHIALDNAIKDCDREQKNLANSKYLSRNNLAGATRDVSISQEMTAAAMACDSRVRAKEREATEAEKVCQDVKCIADL